MLSAGQGGRRGCRFSPTSTSPPSADPAAEVADVLQIPAFLCRQTDLLLAAARTGRAVNVKKGQFLAPEDLRCTIDKAASTGNGRIFVTERGTSFGYHNLVVDMRAFAILRDFGIAGGLRRDAQAAASRGRRRRDRRRPAVHRAAGAAGVAAGVDGVFLEVHPDPARALSDAATQLPFDRAEALAMSLLEIRRTVRASVPLV